MEYGHEQAVADGVNVDYDVYRIRTADHRGRRQRCEAGLLSSPHRDRLHAARRALGELDEDLTYDADQLDRDVVAEDQIRIVVRTFRDRLCTRNLPRPHRGAQDADLRQGRQPRRGHRRDRARGVRQGQRVLPEDHLPDDRRQAGGADQRLPQPLLPADRRHGGHDRHRHRHQAAGDPAVHAQR